VIEKVREEYKRYKTLEFETFNINQMAVKYNLHRTTVYRLIKQWGDEPEFQDKLDTLGEHELHNKKGTVSYQMKEWKVAINQLVQ
jgi:hypothetical protein